MSKKDEIETIIKRDLDVGERVTERKIRDVIEHLHESVDWGDAKDISPIEDKIKKSVDWGDGEDQ